MYDCPQRGWVILILTEIVRLVFFAFFPHLPAISRIFACFSRENKIKVKANQIFHLIRSLRASGIVTLILIF